MKSLSSRIIYPDLFQPAGIEFELPEASYVSVTILDSADTVVTVPVADRHLEAGTHEMRFAMPPKRLGSLFYRITARTRTVTLTETRRLI